LESNFCEPVASTLAMLFLLCKAVRCAVNAAQETL